jgi:hypothetical protein
MLSRIFDPSQDGAITLKMLPMGGDASVDVILLLSYGYQLLKNKTYVLATQLTPAAKRSCISLHPSINKYVRNYPFVNRGRLEWAYRAAGVEVT